MELGNSLNECPQVQGDGLGIASKAAQSCRISPDLPKSLVAVLAQLERQNLELSIAGWRVFVENKNISGREEFNSRHT